MFYYDCKRRREAKSGESCIEVVLSQDVRLSGTCDPVWVWGGWMAGGVIWTGHQHDLGGGTRHRPGGLDEIAETLFYEIRLIVYIVLF